MIGRTNWTGKGIHMQLINSYHGHTLIESRMNGKGSMSFSTQAGGSNPNYWMSRHNRCYLSYGRFILRFR